MKTLIHDSLDRSKERRADQRYSLSGSLPGVLQSEAGDTYNSMTVDISRRGLGLMLDPAPSPGTVIQLLIKEDGMTDLPEILNFTVRHVMESPIHNIQELTDMKRCGVEILDPDRTMDLLEVFSRFDSMIIQE